MSNSNQRKKVMKNRLKSGYTDLVEPHAGLNKLLLVNAAQTVVQIFEFRSYGVEDARYILRDCLDINLLKANLVVHIAIQSVKDGHQDAFFPFLNDRVAFLVPD